jgi:hypothetical protein
MAKQEPKITVIQHLTESEIKNIGGNRWLKRRAKRLVLIFGICIAWIIVVSLLRTQSLTTQWIMLAPSVLFVLIIIVVGNKASKIFWDSVKDKPEPIDLDEIK